MSTTKDKEAIADMLHTVVDPIKPVSQQMLAPANWKRVSKSGSTEEGNIRRSFKCATVQGEATAIVGHMHEQIKWIEVKTPGGVLITQKELNKPKKKEGKKEVVKTNRFADMLDE